MICLYFARLGVAIEPPADSHKSDAQHVRQLHLCDAPAQTEFVQLFNQTTSLHMSHYSVLYLICQAPLSAGSPTDSAFA